MTTHFTTAASDAADVDAAKKRRRRRGLLVGGLLTGGVLAGIVAPMSAHADPQGKPAKATVGSAPEVSPQYSRGFHIYNLSSHPMKLLSITGDGNFEGKPNNGDILMPGVGFHDIEVQWKWMSDQRDTATYQILGDDGRSIGTYKAHLKVEGAFGIPSSTSETTLGVAGGEGTSLSLLDKPGTVLDIPASQGQAQLATLKRLCAENSSAQSRFTATKREKIIGPEHQVGYAFENASDLTGTYTIARTDTVGITDSVGVSVTAGTTLFTVLNVELTAQYGREWSKSEDFTHSVDVEVPPGWEVWLTDSAPLVRDTGDFTITLGNTTWHLRDVYFDSPDPNGNGGTWRLHSKNHNGVPQQTIALSTIPGSTPIVID